MFRSFEISKFELKAVEIKFQISEVYDSILNTLDEQKHKLDNFINNTNFWEKVGFEEYHDTAIVYDYISYVNDHHSNLSSKDFHRLDYDSRRKQAIQSSYDIMNNELYQSDSTDVKFVSLSSSELDHQQHDRHTEFDFESIICVSGFLSQRDNLKESWHAVLDIAGDKKPIFGFKWPAEDYLSIFNRILLEIVNIRFDTFTDITFGDVMAFNGVRSIARESGKLLAHALILEFPKYLPRVTFVSFSLGTEVVKSCLEELHKMNAHGIIKDIYFLGGATTITVNDTDIFDIISGKIIHAYTPSDRILDFYEFSTAEIPIGQDQLGKPSCIYVDYHSKIS